MTITVKELYDATISDALNKARMLRRQNSNNLEIEEVLDTIINALVTPTSGSILAKHARENPNMPVFLLLGQDQHAWQLVEKWVIWADVGVPSVDPERIAKKVGEAREICAQMQRWPLHKAPD